MGDFLIVFHACSFTAVMHSGKEIGGFKETGLKSFSLLWSKSTIIFTEMKERLVLRKFTRIQLHRTTLPIHQDAIYKKYGEEIEALTGFRVARVDRDIPEAYGILERYGMSFTLGFLIVFVGFGKVLYKFVSKTLSDAILMRKLQKLQLRRIRNASRKSSRISQVGPLIHNQQEKEVTEIQELKAETLAKKEHSKQRNHHVSRQDCDSPVKMRRTVHPLMIFRSKQRVKNGGRNQEVAEAKLL